MSTRKDAGMCLACGQEAKLRCSSCASKSGLDLFFCSKEHQRLVWPFHRLVCGERAHPFALPPFSAEEADRVIERMQESPKSENQTKARAYLFRLFGVKPNEFGLFKVSTKLLVGKGGQVVPSTLTPTTAGDEAFYVMELRKFNNSFKPDKSNTWANLFHDPVEYFNFAYDRITRGAPRIQADHFTSTFCHHFAATIPLGDELANKLGDIPRDQKYVHLAHLEQVGGGSAAVERVTLATEATIAFLRTARTPEQTAWAHAVLAEICRPVGADASSGPVIELRT